MTEDRVSRFEFSRAFAGWGWLLQRDAARLFPIVLACSAIELFVQSANSALGLGPGFWLFSTSVFVDPLLIGVTSLIALSDTGADLRDAVGQAFRRYWGLLGVTILSSLGIGLGILLLILPGLALLVLWCISVPVLLVERQGPFEALRSSFQSVRTQFWPIAGLFALYAVAAGLISITLALITPEGGEGTISAIGVAGATVSTAIFVAGVYLNAAIYRELGYTGAHDLSVFD